MKWHNVFKTDAQFCRNLLIAGKTPYSISYIIKSGYWCCTQGLVVDNKPQGYVPSYWCYADELQFIKPELEGQ